MTTLFQDVRYGLRLLWKSPGFTTVAVLSLALGVGANTAIFSIVNAVLLRSLPFPHPERLVKIVASNRGVGARDIGFSVPEFDDLRSRAGVFEQVTATQGGPTNLTGGERPQHLEMLEVSPNYFSMLGTSAHIGRVFGPGDEAQGFAEAVVISDSLWASGFGRDPRSSGAKAATRQRSLHHCRRSPARIPPSRQNGFNGCRNMGDMWIQGRSLPET